MWILYIYKLSVYIYMDDPSWCRYMAWTWLLNGLPLTWLDEVIGFILILQKVEDTQCIRLLPMDPNDQMLWILYNFLWLKRGITSWNYFKDEQQKLQWRFGSLRKADSAWWGWPFVRHHTLHDELWYVEFDLNWEEWRNQEKLLELFIRIGTVRNKDVRLQYFIVYGNTGNVRS